MIQNPDFRLTQALGVFMSDHKMRKTKFLDQLVRLQHLEEFAHPGLEHDRLFRAAYRHRGDYKLDCVGCGSDEIVRRPQRTEEHKKDLVFHQGRIATGNSVIRDGVLRDQIRARCDGALCVEMEAAGVDINRRCLVIRGISDYADSHKNDLWRFHAAGNAAAFTRALLCRIPPGIVQKMEGVKVEEVKEERAVGPWLVPLARPESFVGRKNEITQLSAHVSSDGGQRLAVYGLGGCGKTALALEVAYHTREEQPQRAIFWVPAVSRERFEQAFLEIGTLLSIPGIENNNADVKQLVKAALSDEKFGQWLMIIDNADDTNVLFDPLGEGKDSKRLIDFLPHSRNGSMVFTTRTREAGIKLAKKHIQLDKLDKQDAKEVLRKTLLQKDLLEYDKSVDEFLEILTFLPLAIIQAVAFVNVNEISLSEYIDMFRHNERDATDLLSEEFEDQARYGEIKNAVATTWFISFEKIRQQDRLAAEYLSFMACTTGESVPESLLPPSSSKVEQIRATGRLKAYAFIKQRLQNDVVHESQKSVEIFNVHALVHLATRNWLREKGEWHDWVNKTLTRLVEVIPYGFKEQTVNQRVWAAYLPHATRIVDFPEVREAKVSRDSLLSRIGSCELTIGHYKAAELAYQQAIEQLEEEQTLQKEGTTCALCLTQMNHLLNDYMNNFALALSYQGNYAKAVKIYRDILALGEKDFDKEDPSTLAVMTNLALALSEQGSYVEAEEMGWETLALSEKVLGKEHPGTLTTMNNLAMTLAYQGSYVKAEKMGWKTLALCEKVQGKENIHTLATMNNLAQVLGGQGNFAQAEEIHREVLVLKEKVHCFGKENPHTMTTMKNLAAVLLAQQKYAQAEEMHREVLAVEKKVLGREHPKTLLTMNELGIALGGQEKYTEATEIHREARALREKVLGKEHLGTLTSMFNLAGILRDQGSNTEAVEVYRETLSHSVLVARALSEKLLGREQLQTLVIMENLAMVLAGQLNFTEAEEIHRETLALSKRTLGKEHLRTLEAMNNLALVLEEQESYTEAEKLHRETLALLKRTLGNEHPGTLQSESNLNRTVARQRQEKQAEEEKSE